MKKFNEETPDVEGVKYFSWGAVYEPGLIDTWKYVHLDSISFYGSFIPTHTYFRWSHSVILEKEGLNDGLVSIESAKWVSSFVPFVVPLYLLT